MGRERLDHHHLIGNRIGERHRALRGGLRLREVAGKHRGGGLELQVVTVVHRRRYEPVAPVALMYFSSTAAASALLFADFAYWPVRM